MQKLLHTLFKGLIGWFFIAHCAIVVSAQMRSDSLLSHAHRLPQLCFEVGETVHYDVQYQWGLLKLTAGRVCFQVLQSPEEKVRGQYHFRSVGTTVPRYDWLFSVRDTFQSWVQMPQFEPLRYKRLTHEGDYHVNNSLVFAPPNIYVEQQNSKEGKQSISLAYAKNLFDLQTAVYFVRQLDFEQLPLGQAFYLHIIIDGTAYKMPITNVGIEHIKHSKKTYKCYHLITDVIEGSIFKAHQKIDIWLSADNHRIPIKVEAPIIIGRVKAVLRE